MKDWLVYAAYRVGAGLVGAMPEPVVRRMGEALGWLSWLWADTRKQMAIRHMRRVLGPDADHEQAARRMFSAYGRYWAETFWFRPRREESVRAHVSLEGTEHLEAAQAAGRSIVVASLFLISGTGRWRRPPPRRWG